MHKYRTTRRQAAETRAICNNRETQLNITENMFLVRLSIAGGECGGGEVGGGVESVVVGRGSGGGEPSVYRSRPPRLPETQYASKILFHLNIIT